ncbi:MAG: peptide ABC transporter substrate-binding protein [Erysipelotrichaceae bacterium]|nr:peptide ABC transporter substrate-binding protein [Erysipelotrichaceae bacterium]
MKKLIISLLAVLLLVGCSSTTTKPTTTTEETDDTTELTTSSKELTVATNREVKSMDYVTTALASDHEINGNLVDGLLENNANTVLVGALAEEWSGNEDKTVWTFKLRPDVTWVTATGEEYDTVKAEDFVTGLRHGAEFDSGTSWLLQGVIDGYSEYLTSDFSDEAWSKVGVKAVDELTVEYTMAKDDEGNSISVPYFDSMTTYAVLFPVNKQFLESKGEGCKLGTPDKESCEFGTVKLDSILYNGAYILTTNDDKSQAVLTKNEAYWDAENVFMEKVTRIYDAGEDPYSTIKGFEQGIYSQASLNTTWEDYQTYLDKYEDNAYFSIPNASVFGVVFNYNRQVFNETNYATDSTLKENTIAAIRNENFRKAIRAAFDLKAYLSIGAPEALALESIRNVNNFPEAGTQSDGTLYYDQVTKTYNEATGENRDLNDGVDTFLSKEEALAYIDAAKEDGIEFPIHLDMLVNETSDSQTKKANSMKKSIEENTDGQIVIELVLRNTDTVNNIAYYNNDPAAADYDISTYTGWGPDYADPKTFVDIYSPITGYYMTSMGLGTVDKDGKVEDLEIKELVGLMEYEELYRVADAIVDDMDARYQAFAKADAFLVEKAFYIPTSQQTRGQLVSKIVPFSRPYSPYGTSEYKYKNLRLQDDIVTVEQYDKAYETWLKNK